MSARELHRSTRSSTYLTQINDELARVDGLEAEYWQAWRRSAGDRKRTRAVKSKQSARATETASLETQSQAGDPRYLEGVQWCMQRRWAMNELRRLHG